MLIPYTGIEAVDVPFAAVWVGVSAKTIRDWCRRHAVGRQVGGRWMVSRFALPMFLEGDHVGLALYHAGDRSSPHVLSYGDRMLIPRAFRQKCEETKETGKT